MLHDGRETSRPHSSHDTPLPQANVREPRVHSPAPRNSGIRSSHLTISCLLSSASRVLTAVAVAIGNSKCNHLLRLCVLHLLISRSQSNPCQIPFIPAVIYTLHRGLIYRYPSLQPQPLSSHFTRRRLVKLAPHRYGACCAIHNSLSTLPAQEGGSLSLSPCVCVSVYRCCCTSRSKPALNWRLI